MATQLVDPTTAQAWMSDALDMTTFDQDTFDAAIEDASQAIIDELEWDPSVQTVTEVYTGLGSNEMIVNRKQITSVASITIAPPPGPPGCIQSPVIVDVTTLLIPGGDDRSIIWGQGCFPRMRKNITINYTAGYATIPGSIVRATLYTLRAMWTAPAMEANATGEAYTGVMSQQFWATGPGAVPPQALRLIRRYKIDLLAT